MKRYTMDLKRLLALLVAVFCLHVHAAGLVFWDVMNTGPVFCNGARIFEWSNTSGQPLRVVMTRQWTGVDLPMEADVDVATWVTDANGNVTSFLTRQQLDAYKTRNFEQERWVSFAPNYIEIPAGGGIRMQLACARMSGGYNVHALLSIIYQ